MIRVRTILFGGLLVLLLVLVAPVLAPNRGAHSVRPNGLSSDPDGALIRLANAFWQLFGDYAEFDISVQMTLWDQTPPELRPVVGMLKFAHLLAAIWGIVTLLMAGRMIRLIRQRLQ